MKRFLPLPALAAFLLLSGSIVSNAQPGQSRRAVFLGNSYTAVNNLPQLIADVAKSAGDTLLYTANMPGGTTLEQHANNPASLALIASGNADYVVLQEQSQLPSFPDAQVAASFYPFAKKLDSLADAQNECSQTVFYRTWGRQNGDPQNCANFPPLCTYNGMDSLLNLRYRNAADSAQALLSPVGNVWKRLRTSSPAINLYDADQSHPSLAGSYAAACTFYAIFFSKSPLLITDNGGLPAGIALTIRQAATTVVFDSLSKWNVGRWPAVKPTAGFSYSVVNGTAAFINTSTPAGAYHWDFGNETLSTLATPPAVTYAQPGIYNVRLIATRCNQADTTVKSVSIGVSGINGAMAVAGGIYLSPNPALTQVQISGEGIKGLVSVLNTAGQLFAIAATPSSKGFVLEVSSLPAGLYSVNVATGKGIETLRFLKK